MDNVEVFEKLKLALEALRDCPPSRENSIAITHLETAIMWFNKGRTNSGELTPTPTHV